MVDAHPMFTQQLLMFPIDVTIVVVFYISLIRLIVMSSLGLLDRLYPEWDPGLDARVPSLRRMQRRRTVHNPLDHRWDHRRKRYKRQWARTRLYPFRIRRFKFHTPDVFPQDQEQEKKSQMPFLLSVFCIAAGTERWISKRFRRVPKFTSLIIRAFLFFARRRRPTPMFRAFAGTVDDANERPRHVRFDTDSFRLGIDTFATGCMSPDKDHFITYTKAEGQECKGIAAGLKIAGRGTLRFRIDDDDGVTHTITVPNSVHIPDLPMVLVSPQHWAQQTTDNTESTSCAKHTVLSFRGYKKTIPYSAQSNTPSFRSTPGTLRYQAFAAVVEHGTATSTSLLRSEHIVTEDEESSSEGASEGDADGYNADEELPMSDREGEQQPKQSRHGTHTKKCSHKHATTHLQPHADDAERLTVESPQADLLRWHYRLGHLSFKLIKAMAEVGLLPKKLAKAPVPKCAGCMFAGMTKKPWRSKGKQNSQVGRMTKITRPGQCISVDMLESPQVGFIAHMKGRLTKKRYKYATVFVDHYSDLKYVHYMSEITSEETIYAKKCFERYSAGFNVKVEHYHCDNGRFADNAFIQHCEGMGQGITYCGVNAHFQNGRAEKAIRDLQTMARKMLLHAKGRWPEAIHLSLWPYAMRMAVHVHNNVPHNEDASSRLESFARIAVSPKSSHYHTFGCPVFALTTEAEQGKAKKWEVRSVLGIYLGPSPHHAGSVSLVLSLTTGLASPQFHVGHDDFFETTRYNRRTTRISSNWQKLSGIDFADIIEKKQKIKKAALTSSKPTVDQNVTQIVDFANQAPVFEDSTNNNVRIPTGTPSPSTAEPTSTIAPTQVNQAQASAVPPQINTIASPPPAPRPPTPPPPTALPDASSRGRQRKVSARMQESLETGEFQNSMFNAFQSTFETQHDLDLELQDRMRNPMAFLAEMQGDTMYFHQAMAQDDSGEFVEAVVKEVNGHVDNTHWELIPIESVPEDTDILPSVWSMRRKRNLVTNEITKYKARLNVHGGKQTFGENYFDTYAPVVTWFAIRLLIICAIVLHWKLRQVDFIMAYAQAPIECDMYLQLPDGIETETGNSKTHVLKLLRNVYGQKQAGKVWADFLSENLFKIGFERSKIDECVFYRGNLVFLVYVDDGIFVSLDGTSIDGAIKELMGSKLKLEDQGHPADYVGVNIKKQEDESYEFTQPALTQQIIEDVGLGPKSTTKPIPMCAQRLLHHHLDSAPHDESKFKYRSVIGKLNYLAQCTRPDIVYAVHQCARFSSNPRQEHTDAVEYIARYLKGTSDLGLHFKPDTSKSFECYADADYCGNWSRSFAETDPSTAKSRSGWIIMYAGCPIIWASKLQTHVATSTTMAEYIALSAALRDVIPIMELMDELRDRGYELISTEPIVYCKAFEDNSGALEIARLPKMRPRTKAINVIYHHFREYVRLGLIKIYPISTDDQVADIFTKPLTQNPFVKHRVKICGT